MLRQVTINVLIESDPEAGVWCASSEDVLGLAIESDSLDGLMRRLSDVIPELIALNGLPAHVSQDGGDVPIDLLIQSHQRLELSH